MAATMGFARRTISQVFTSNFVHCKRCLALGVRFKSTESQFTPHGNDESTHFGYENVSKEEKTKRVHEVFTKVAEKYDVMNDAMSLGIHRIWKDYFMQKLTPMPGTKLLDVAGGTGLIRVILANSKKMKNLESWPQNPTEAEGDTSSSDEEGDSHHVTVCDINKNMLDVGQKRAAQRGLMEGISWVEGNAEELPFDSDSMDAYTIAFGIRNVTRVQKALDEAYRVLKPGGRFMCLEFSEVKNPLVKNAYDLYSFQVIPALGQILAGDWNSYQYLIESIRKFPPQEEFAYMIEEAGFACVTVENLSGGIAAIHSGFKL
ncbi:putative 2-methoxy-6-polyprenyl-1,4-benzoquinol methylase, mitochondrial [Apostichopus japonicus]|uniref:2-methoxy-6-polyprenyl-1,4-benzoquinol methylase, mitochondrial n=1 Tax=Stichopus japonicus TaxID=307972 RepID=A0A2G8KI82_STIJA|nr:putative 2-methoxy-6-polyprenyl-1,4-benzoquinol methylase, mitochondrial [Apostichopus japonicus]